MNRVNLIGFITDSCTDFHLALEFTVALILLHDLALTTFKSTVRNIQEFRIPDTRKRS